MSKSIISFIFLMVFTLGFSQEKNAAMPKVNLDSIVYKTAYGLRLGIDISKPIIAAFSDTYNGYEVVGDYRISKNFYLAAEIGFEKATTIEDYTNSTSKGNYLRIGFNYNNFENWLDMNNEIFTGVRYGLGIFEQRLNSYTPNANSTYFPSQSIENPMSESGLMAHWTELLLGIKVETFKNVFVSASVSYKILISVNDQKNFKSLSAPGFNRIFDSGTGFGFNYTLSYLIPFSKK